MSSDIALDKLICNKGNTSTQCVRAVLTVTLLIGSWLLLRRGLLVLLLAAKILGYADALNAWQGAVSRRTIMRAGIPVDLYRGGNPVSPLLIVHGVNPTGKD